MKKIIRIESNGHPNNTLITWIPTGEIIPVLSFNYSMSVETLGKLVLEVPGFFIESHIETKDYTIRKNLKSPLFRKKDKYLLDRIHNQTEMLRLGLERIN